MQQQPTCRGLRIRSIVDATKILLVTEQGFLQKVTRRLDVAERLAVCSGNVYVWEAHKKDANGGMERFTDGRKWHRSQERMVGLG
jgi:hypothetical protein